VRIFFPQVPSFSSPVSLLLLLFLRKRHRLYFPTCNPPFTRPLFFLFPFLGAAKTMLFSPRPLQLRCDFISWTRVTPSAAPPLTSRPMLAHISIFYHRSMYPPPVSRKCFFRAWLPVPKETNRCSPFFLLRKDLACYSFSFSRIFFILTFLRPFPPLCQPAKMCNLDRSPLRKCGFFFPMRSYPLDFRGIRLINRRFSLHRPFFPLLSSGPPCPTLDFLEFPRETDL